MQLSASRPAEGKYYQSEEYRLWFDTAAEKIFLEKTLVRYGPSDDFDKEIDLCISFEDLSIDPNAQKYIADWFGERALVNVFAEIEIRRRESP